MSFLFYTFYTFLFNVGLYYCPSVGLVPTILRFMSSCSHTHYHSCSTLRPKWGLVSITHTVIHSSFIL